MKSKISRAVSKSGQRNSYKSSSSNEADLIVDYGSKMDIAFFNSTYNFISKYCPDLTAY